MGAFQILRLRAEHRAGLFTSISSTPALSCSCLLDRAQSKAHTPEQARIEAKNSRENTSTRTVNTRPAQGSYELVERRYFLTVQCGLSIYFLTVQCGLSMQLLPMLLTPRQPHASGRLSSPWGKFFWAVIKHRQGSKQATCKANSWARSCSFKRWHVEQLSETESNSIFFGQIIPNSGGGSSFPASWSRKPSSLFNSDRKMDCISSKALACLHSVNCRTRSTCMAAVSTFCIALSYSFAKVAERWGEAG